MKGECECEIIRSNPKQLMRTDYALETSGDGGPDCLPAVSMLGGGLWIMKICLSTKSLKMMLE